LRHLAKEIWLWCQHRKGFISADHIPEAENIQADFFSRDFNSQTEWSLNSVIFCL